MFFNRIRLQSIWSHALGRSLFSCVSSLLGSFGPVGCGIPRGRRGARGTLSTGWIARSGARCCRAAAAGRWESGFCCGCCSRQVCFRRHYGGCRPLLPRCAVECCGHGVSCSRRRNGHSDGCSRHFRGPCSHSYHSPRRGSSLRGHHCYPTAWAASDPSC